MTRRTELDFVRDEADTLVEQSRIGFVTKVYVHDGTEERLSNHEVNVQLTSGQEEYRKIPIHTDHNGSIYVPQEGDAVEVAFLAGRTERPYVANVIHTDEQRAPLGRPGHFRREFGPDTGSQLYIEAEQADHSAGDPNVVRLGKKPDGLSDPSTAVEVDDSGNTTEINIETDGNINLAADANVTLTAAGNVDLTIDGNVTLNANGDITIDSGGSPKSVLTEDAVFEYEQIEDTKDGSGSAVTKETTTVSNNETTTTTID